MDLDINSLFLGLLIGILGILITYILLYKKYEKKIKLEKKTTAEDISGTVGMKFVTEDGSGNKMGSSAIVLEPSGNSYAMNFYVKTGSDPMDTSDKMFGIENDAKMNIYAPMVIKPKKLGL